MGSKTLRFATRNRRDDFGRSCLALCILIFLFLVTKLWELSDGSDHRVHQIAPTAYVISTFIRSLTIDVADDMILLESEDLLIPTSRATYKPMPTQFPKHQMTLIPLPLMGKGFDACF